MNPIYAELIQQLTFAAVTAVIAYLTPKVRDWLQAHVHARDMDLLTGALGRAGQLAAQDVLAGKAPSLETAAAGMVEYAKANLPETVQKLGPTETALAQMATAILLEKLGGRLPAVK